MKVINNLRVPASRCGLSAGSRRAPAGAIATAPRPAGWGRAAPGGARSSLRSPCAGR